MSVQNSITLYGSESSNAVEMQLQVNLIQDILQKVMKAGTHYGVIPGTQSNSLYKPGAEKIMATFRLVADPEVEDLGANGEVHYRVKLRLLTANGTYLGAGIGECSSREDKYAWRGQTCKAEYDATPEGMKRVKYKRDGTGIAQVRTNPADVANTILKMAKKRALVDAVLTVTAASDIFTQDIEDLPDELVAEFVGNPGRQSVAPVENIATPPELQAAAEAAAGKGKESFREYWSGLAESDRRLLQPVLEQLKRAAVEFDARQVEPSEVGGEA